MDSMDYSYHDSSDASSSGNPNPPWHSTSEVSWPPFFSQPSTASSQASPDLASHLPFLFPYNQEISLAAFGYDFSEHLSAFSSQGVPTMPQDLFYPPPAPSHSSPTDPFALSAHSVQSASLVPQRDRGILFQPRAAAALHRHQGDSSSSHVQPSASVPQRGQSLTIPRRSPATGLRSRYAFSQPSLDAYTPTDWVSAANNLSVNATSAGSMSPNISDEASARQPLRLSQTQNGQSSTAFRNPVQIRQPPHMNSYTSTPRLHPALHQTERRRMIQHRHQQHRSRPSASGSRIISENSPSAAEEPLGTPRSSSSIPSSRRGLSLTGNTEQSTRIARISRLDSNRLLVPKWIMDSLEKVDVNELDESDKACVICYNDYHTESPEGNKEVPLRLPKCKHVFGSDCIRKWFKESNSCPYCRDKVRPDIKNTKASSGAFVNLMRIRGWTGHDGTPEDIYRQVVLGRPSETSQGRRSVGERRPVPENAEEQPRRTRQRLSGASDGEVSDSVVYGEFRIPTGSSPNGSPRFERQNGPERPHTIVHREASQSTPGNESPSRSRSSATQTTLRSEHLTSVFNISSIPDRLSMSSLNEPTRRHASQLPITQRQYSPQPEGLLPSTGETGIRSTSILNPLDRTLMPNQAGPLSTGMVSPRPDPMWPMHPGRHWI